MPAAAWTRKARDLTYSPNEWADYLTAEQIQHATGLSHATLRDSMARPEITNPAVPRGALCRPAARIGPIPMWSPAQRDEYLRRVRQAEIVAKSSAARLNELPKYTMAEARERGLTTIEDLAQELGCAINPLRRLGRDQNMPAPVALARRDYSQPQGRQHELRDRIATLRWLREYSRAEDARDRIAVPEHLLAEIELHDRERAAALTA